MRHDNQDNVPKNLVRQGMAGFTLLVFLLTQAVWPLPVAAWDTLREQSPSESKSGLEGLKSKLQGKGEQVTTPSTATPVVAAGMEETKEPDLTEAERHSAQGRYRLPPEGFALEYDPSRSVPCCLGHPPLLWRVRVIDATTGQPAYIGTGCCQTLFGKTPAEISTAQTTANHHLAQVAKYASVLGNIPANATLLQAIHEQRLAPEHWQQVHTLLTVLDAHYGFPIEEIERMARELRSAPRLRRLLDAGLITSGESSVLEQVLLKLSPDVVQNPPTQQEVQTLHAVHTRLAKHPLFLTTRTLRGWARGETPTPLSIEEREREERRMPNWSANLWIANLLLPGILEGTVTNVLDGGAGEEPLYRLLSQVGGPDAGKVVINVELHPETYAIQTNPRRLQMSITDLRNPLTPPPTPEAAAAAQLLTQDESIDAIALVYVLDQLKTPAQHKQTIGEATRVAKLNAPLIIVLPLGKELSLPYLQALERAGWTRRPGFPAEIPRPDQRGLPDALRALHGQQLQAEGLKPDEIDQILAIEDRFFRKSSYAVIFDKTKSYDPNRLRRIPTDSLILLDVGQERGRSGLPAPRGLAIRPHFLHAVLLAQSVTPDQLAVQTSAYQTKADIQAAIQNFERHLEALERYLPLLPTRTVAGRPHAQEEAQRLLTLWHDPTLATFNEDDARWLEAVYQEQIFQRMYNPIPADRIQEAFPDFPVQMARLSEAIPWGDPDHSSHGAVREAFEAGRALTLSQIDSHFERYRRHMGMLFPEADRWYRQQHPPQPSYEMIPTTLHGHLLVIDAYARDAGERGGVSRYLERLEIPEARWIPEELEVVHRDYLQAMARDAEWEEHDVIGRRKSEPGWSLRNIITEIRRRLDSVPKQPVTSGIARKEVPGAEVASRKLVRGGWNGALIISGLTLSEIEKMEEGVLKEAAAKRVRAQGKVRWAKPELLALVSSRRSLGLSVDMGAVLADGFDSAYGSALREYPVGGWDGLLKDSGLSDEEIAAIHRAAHLRAEKEISAAQGLQTWSRSTIREFVLSRSNNESLLPGVVPRQVARAARREWGSWEAALADILDKSLDEVKQLLERQRQEGYKAGVAKRRETLRKKRSGSDPSGADASSPHSGLEERQIDDILAILEEALQKGPGVLVIEAGVISQRMGLSEFVARIPQPLGGRIILFGKESLEAKEVAARNGITLVDSDRLTDLVLQLLVLGDEADRVGYVGDPALATALSDILPRSMEVTPLDPATALSRLLLFLRYPQPVLDGINASGLEEQLARLHSA